MELERSFYVWTGARVFAATRAHRVKQLATIAAPLAAQSTRNTRTKQVHGVHSLLSARRLYTWTPAPMKNEACRFDRQRGCKRG